MLAAWKFADSVERAISIKDFMGQMTFHEEGLYGV